VKDRRFLRRCKSYACYLTDGSLAAESLALDRGLFGLCHHAITPVSSATLPQSGQSAVSPSLGRNRGSVS